MAPTNWGKKIKKTPIKEILNIIIISLIGVSIKLDIYFTKFTAFKNLGNLLKECNSGFQDVVKINTYIVNFNPEVDLLIFRKIRNLFLSYENYPASTLVGVSVLGDRNWLIEIEATAVIFKKVI